MSLNRQTAPPGIRLIILTCLRDENYFIYPDGQRHLNNVGIRASYIIEDLIAELEEYELFKFPASPYSTKEKFDYVIPYDDSPFLVYVKMTPEDTDPPFLYLTFHSHNIPGKPLPRIPLDPKP